LHTLQTNLNINSTTRRASKIKNIQLLNYNNRSSINTADNNNCLNKFISRTQRLPSVCESLIDINTNTNNKSSLNTFASPFINKNNNSFKDSHSSHSNVLYSTKQIANLDPSKGSCLNNNILTDICNSHESPLTKNYKQSNWNSDILTPNKKGVSFNLSLKKEATLTAFIQKRSNS